MDLLLNVPLARAEETIAAPSLVSKRLDFEDLPPRFGAALGRKLDVRVGGQVRHVGAWDQDSGDGE